MKCVNNVIKVQPKTKNFDLLEEMLHSIKDCQYICCTVYIRVATATNINAIFVANF